MQIKELQFRLNEYINNEGINTRNYRATRGVLLLLVSDELKKILNYSDFLSQYIIEEYRNKIVLKSDITETELLTIRVKYIKVYGQLFYIDELYFEVAEGIETIEDIERKCEEIKLKHRTKQEKEKTDLINFMQQHNIKKDEMRKFSALFRKYKYYI